MPKQHGQPNRFFQTVVKSFFGGYDWVSSGDPGNISSSWGGRGMSIAGTSVDWSRITGDMLQNATALSCYLWIWQNFNQARLMVQQKKAEGAGEEIENHPLTALLEAPNPYWAWQTLNAAVLHDLLEHGNAFLVIGRRGVIPDSLVWVSQSRMSPDKSNKNLPVPMDRWKVRTPMGGYDYLPLEDVVHFRMGVDPEEPRLGFSPFRALKRQQYSLDQAANYGANTLRNMGSLGGIATPELENQTFDPEDFVQKYNAKTRGDAVGSMMALDVPVKLQYPKNTPQDMALDTIQDRPEADICAVMGVPPQVVGAHVGRHSKTYANMKEAREIAWEETMIPVLNLISDTLTRFLLPQMMGSAAKGQKVAFDIKDIRPLQPDLDKLHDRARADWLAGLIDRAEWKLATGQTPLPEDKGVYCPTPQAVPPKQGAGATTPKGNT